MLFIRSYARSKMNGASNQLRFINWRAQAFKDLADEIVFAIDDAEKSPTDNYVND